MKLTKPDIPLDIMRAYTSGLAYFVDPSTPLWSLLSQNYMALEAHHLHLETVPDQMGGWLLDAAAEDKSPKYTKSGGWRFWAAAGDVYGACHVGSIDPALPPRVTGFSKAPQVLAGIERFNQLADLPELDTVAFEPRVLRIGWCHLEAFWLKSTVAGVADRIVVFSGFPPEDDPPDSYSWEEFREKIWGRVQKALQHDREQKENDNTARQRARDLQVAAARAIVARNP
jgi:hypothetical protein